MQMFFTRECGEVIEFTYTFPEEEWHHSTRKLAKSDVKLITKKDRSEAALVRGEIVDDVLLDLPKRSSKKAPVPEKRKVRGSRKAA